MDATPERGADDATRAVIFDMDGVITRTAEVHFAVWKDVFDEFLRERQDDGGPFTRRDYLDHVDGVPRYDGVRRFLRSRGIDLPEGEPDAGGPHSVHGLGNAKNRRFRAWLDENEVPVFDDAVYLIDCLKAAGIAVGVFSASRNARAVLTSAGIADVFDATVDGADARKRDLAAKPDPAQLVETARRLGVHPSRAAVVEDAISGVQAGCRGRFGLVVGVNRQEREAGEQRHALRANGADLVTTDLRRLALPDRSGLRTLDRLPLVRDQHEELQDRFAGRPLSVFLDYDGTLSPIVADYRNAFLPDGMAGEIEAVAERCPVAIISGRDLQDVRERVGVEGAIYAGSHGFDIAGPGGLSVRPEQAESFLEPVETAARDLREGVSGIEGAEIEQKAFSIAVHFRRVAEADVERLERIVDDVVERHESLRKGRGKKVIEIQPRADWDKGRAVTWLLDNTRLGEDGRLPLYIGDDLTDEDAFAALIGRGLSLAVRGKDRVTLADYALQDTDDVRRFLAWLKTNAEADS